MGTLSFSQNRDGGEVFFCFFFFGGEVVVMGRILFRLDTPKTMPNFYQQTKTWLRELIRRPQLPISYPSQSQEDIRMFKYFDLISPKIGN